MGFPSIKKFMKLQSPSAIRLRELSLFHSPQNPLVHTLKHIENNFNEHNLKYSIIGGMAVNYFGYKRSTSDVDLIISEPDFLKFEQLYNNSNQFDYRFKNGNKFAYINRLSRYKWIDKRNNVNIDLISTNENNNEVYIPFPEPISDNILIDEKTRVHYSTLPNLISLKLGSFTENGLRRSKDQSDVVELMTANKLDENFAVLLHPKIRHLYLKMYEVLKNSGNSKFE